MLLCSQLVPPPLGQPKNKFCGRIMGTEVMTYLSVMSYEGVRLL